MRRCFFSGSVSLGGVPTSPPSLGFWRFSVQGQLAETREFTKISSYAYLRNPCWSSQSHPRSSLELVRPSCYGCLGPERFFEYHCEDPDRLHVVYLAPSLRLLLATRALSEPTPDISISATCSLLHRGPFVSGCLALGITHFLILASA